MVGSLHNRQMGLNIHGQLAIFATCPESKTVLNTKKNLRIGGFYATGSPEVGEPAEGGVLQVRCKATALTETGARGQTETRVNTGVYLIYHV